jgi:iron complex transport system ATP-binding protein
MSLIEFSNVSFFYGDNENYLINDVSFSVAAGDFDSLIGLNGAGKTTLLKLLTAQLFPVEGTIRIHDKEITDYSLNELAKIVAFVPQDYSSNLPYAVFDFVSSGRTPFMNFFGVPKSDDIEVIEKYLDLLQISNLRNKAITEISGGELRRTMIARALVQEPEVILLDEPNAHLDIEHQLAIYKLLEKLNLENGKTILTVSHDLNLTAMFSKNVLFLQNGNLHKSSSKEFLTQKNISKFFHVNSDVTESTNNLNITILRD